MAVTSSTLVVATEDGWLVGLEPSTAQHKRWEKKIDTSINADLVVSGDTVLIAPKRLRDGRRSVKSPTTSASTPATAT